MASPTDWSRPLGYRLISERLEDRCVPAANAMDDSVTITEDDPATTIDVLANDLPADQVALYSLQGNPAVIPEDLVAYIDFESRTSEGGFRDHQVGGNNDAASMVGTQLMWNFESGNLTVSQTIGGDATANFFDMAAENATRFNNTGSDPQVDDLPNGSGEFLFYDGFPTDNGKGGYTVDWANFEANGDTSATRVNNFSVIVDVYLPTLDWTALFNTDPGHTNDADFYIRNDGALGIPDLNLFSNAGLIQANQWYRIGFVRNFSADTLAFYVDGMQVFTTSAGNLDQENLSLLPSSNSGPDFVFFGEGNSDTDRSNSAYVNSLYVADFALPDAQMTALGEPMVAGVAPYFTETVDNSLGMGFGQAAFLNRAAHEDLLAVVPADQALTSAQSVNESLEIAQTGLDFAEDKSFSAVVWVNLPRPQSSGATGPVLLGNKDNQDPANQGWALEVNGTAIQGNLGDGSDSGTTGSTTIDQDVWALAALVVDRATNQASVVVGDVNDSALSVTSLPLDNLDSLITPNGLTLNLGEDGTGNFSFNFVGLVDDLSLWNRALNFGELDAIFQQGKAGIALPSLLAAAETTLASEAKVSLQTNGTILYDGKGKFDFLPEGDSTTDTFVYGATDLLGQDEATVTITITGVNDLPVAMDKTFSVSENASNDNVVGTLPVSDPDLGDVLTYTINSGNDAGVFALDMATGVLTVADDTQLDFETTPQFVLSVTATDTAGGFDDAIITIDLRDQNEPPTVQDVNFTIPEDAGVGFPVGTVRASDPDMGDNLTFSIIGGNDGGTFLINATTGLLTVTNPMPLDFETQPSFTLTVQVMDSAGLTDEATVSIAVDDVNEPPDARDTTLTLPEDAGDNTMLGSVVATDQDAGDTLTFAITAGNQAGLFAIDVDTGVITLVDSGPIDFELTPTYTLGVQVRDAAGRTDNATVFINVSNTNEPPQARDASFDLPEGTAAGFILATVIASDPDLGDTLTFALVGGNDDGAFAITPSNGRVTVADGTALDFETTPVRELLAEVTDAGGLSDIATLTVTLTDVPEAPVLTDTTFPVSENSPAGTIIGTVVAFDSDSPDGLFYRIVAGNSEGRFSLDSDTGVLTLNEGFLLNFEVQNNFPLTIQVLDPIGLQGSATFTVAVSNVNEAPNLENASFTIPENSPARTTVGTLTFRDPDLNETLTFLVTSGVPADVLSIDELGVIRVNDNALLDFEATPILTIGLEVRDDGGLSDNASLILNLQNINEVPSLEPATFTIPEDTPTGTVVGSLVASDPDVGQVLTYQITAGNPNNAFTVDAITGQLLVTDTVLLDFETLATYNLTVQILDSAAPPATATATVVVNLTDANDPPVVTPEAFTLSRSAPNGTVVGTVTASDPNPGDTLSFALALESNTGLFAIGPVTGVLSLADRSQFIPGQTEYPLTVEARDSQGAVGEAEIKVTAIVDTTPPVGVDDLFAVLPNTGATRLDVLANDSDPDGDSLSVIRVTMPANGVVTIEDDGSAVLYQPQAGFLGLDTFSYTLSDGNDGLDTATVTVEVTPDANRAPVALDDLFTIEPTGAAVDLDVLANDGDLNGDPLTIVSASEPNSGTLSIINNGTLLNYQPVDDFFGVIQFNYTISDGQGGSDTGLVIVNLLFPGNNLPEANDDIARVAQDAPPTQINVLANDRDPDGQDLTIVATTTPVNGTVVIREDGRGLSYQPNPSFEGSDVFNYTITDGLGGSANARVTVTVGGRPVDQINSERFAVSTGPGGPGQILLYQQDGGITSSITPITEPIPGGLRVAVADVNGDSTPDTIVGTGPGVASQVQVINGVSGSGDILATFTPFEASFLGGVFVTAGDVNGDGFADIVITPDQGGGARVVIYSGADGSLLANFFGIEDPNFFGGARAAVGDMNGDGRADIALAAGFLGGPRIAVWDGESLTSEQPRKFVNDFFVFEQGLRNGAFVTMTDLDGDGLADLVAGGGPGGGPRIRIFDAVGLLSGQFNPLDPFATQRANFFAGNPDNRGGIRVTGKDLDNDGLGDLVVAAGDDAPGQVTRYLGSNLLADGNNPAPLDTLTPFGDFFGGLFVG